MSHQPYHVYEFGSYRLDPTEHLLLLNGAAVQLQPKVFDLLLALVEHSGRLLEKDELMSIVWPDAVVEEANLANNISILRKILNENGQQFIQTVPKHGYRFVVPVREELVAGRREIASTTAVEPAGRSSKHSLQAVRLRRWLIALILILTLIGIAGAINLSR
jgi:DNA-binding winged helix-turn-helix (wHTH) protein